MSSKHGDRDLFAAAPLPQAVLDDRQRLACLRLIRSENVGPVTFRELINRYGGATAALEALPELVRRAGRGRAVRICPRDRAEAELAAARRLGAELVFTIEPGYPRLLAFEPVPPPLLYVRGRAELLNRPSVAIVGSRNCSAAGLTLTRRLARELGAAGWVVVSGLARGIDRAAHEATLETGTVAVVAGGIDFVYPPEHAALQERIAAEGCLVSEQPPGFQPRGQDFPRRNRIISGLARGIVVVEAARRSGSLITARMAGEQGREVFAVPGHPLDPRAEGTNDLFMKGATMVTRAADILAALATQAEPVVAPEGRGLAEATQPPAPVRDPIAPVSDADALDRVLAALDPAPVSLDDLARAVQLPVHAVRAACLELGLAGLVTHHGHHLVTRAVASG